MREKKESWVLNNWCFWTVVLEETLKSPLNCKEIQPVHPKEISPGCSLEGLILKLKLQYFGHLMRRADSFEKTLMLGKIEGSRRRGWQRKRWLDGITDSMDMSLSKSRSWWWTERPGMLQLTGSQRVRHDWATELNEKRKKNAYIYVYMFIYTYIYIRKRHTHTNLSLTLFSVVVYCHLLINPSGPLKVEELDT